MAYCFIICSNVCKSGFCRSYVNDDTTLAFQLVITNSKGVYNNPSVVTITVEPSSNNGGNGASSTGDKFDSRSNAIAHSGNANGGKGGNEGADINTGHNWNGNGG